MTALNILEIFTNFGIEGAKGADSIIKAAMFATGAAAAKMVTEKDAADLYAAYRTGFDGEVMLSDNLTTDDKLKVQVSCFRTFLKPAVVRNGEIHGRALQIRNKIAVDQRKHSVYNGLVALNRVQIKKGDKPLTDAEIRECLEKTAPVEKGELEKLEALLATIQSADDKFGGLLDAIAAVERRIASVKRIAELAAKQDDSDEDGTQKDDLLDIMQKVNGAAALVH